RSDSLDKKLIEPASVFGRSGGSEPWALAAAHISVQSELRNREHAASHVLHAAVHFSLLVFKDAKTGDFFGEISSIALGVFLSHGQQNQQSQADLAASPIFDGDLGAADALHDGTHTTFLRLRASLLGQVGELRLLRPMAGPS